MAGDNRPNFIFILADDLGFADLGCYGSRPPTCSPALDRMAAEGVRFTDAYSNSPVCSPTRLSLITGRYQYRLRAGAEEPLTRPACRSGELGLPPNHPTLSSLLRDAGYATCLIGKWHLGFPPHFGPLKSGYDEFFGVMSGGVDYFTHCDPAGLHDLHEGESKIQQPGYLTDLLTARAQRFVEERCGRPFFLSLHYTAPHWPWETRADEAECERIHGSIVHLDGGSVETYRKMIGHMDEGIGALLETLGSTGADENTLVVFTSDNGGERFSDNWPLMGGKMDLLEGGIRVPLVARWPRRIAAGRTTAQLTMTMDWTATLLQAAGVAPHPDYPLDGLSLLEILQSPDRAVDRKLFWRMKYRQQKAMRAGRFKYLAIEGNEFLYDLQQDARERANLADRQGVRLAEMRASYAAWEASIPPIHTEAKVSILYDRTTMAMP